MAIHQAERSLLARIGFFLCRDGEVPEAEAIFSALNGSAPEKDGPVIGLALCRMLAGEGEEAAAMLDERLQKGGDLAPALSLYKLLALGMAGRIADARLLRDQMERNGLAETVKTADQLLEELTRRDAS